MGADGSAVVGRGGGSGVGGSGECTAFEPRDCRGCLCENCGSEWSACRSDAACADLVDCIATVGCDGVDCPTRCPAEWSRATMTSAINKTVSLMACGSSARCMCRGQVRSGTAWTGLGKTGGYATAQVASDPGPSYADGSNPGLHAPPNRPDRARACLRGDQRDSRRKRSSILRGARNRGPERNLRLVRGPPRSGLPRVARPSPLAHRPRPELRAEKPEGGRQRPRLGRADRALHRHRPGAARRGVSACSG